MVLDATSIYEDIFHSVLCSSTCMSSHISSSLELFFYAEAGFLVIRNNEFVQ